MGLWFWVCVLPAWIFCCLVQGLPGVPTCHLFCRSGSGYLPAVLPFWVWVCLPFLGGCEFLHRSFSGSACLHVLPGWIFWMRSAPATVLNTCHSASAVRFWIFVTCTCHSVSTVLCVVLPGSRACVGPTCTFLPYSACHHSGFCRLLPFCRFLDFWVLPA